MIWIELGLKLASLGLGIVRSKPEIVRLVLHHLVAVAHHQAHLSLLLLELSYLFQELCVLLPQENYFMLAEVVAARGDLVDLFMAVDLVGRPLVFLLQVNWDIERLSLNFSRQELLRLRLDIELDLRHLVEDLVGGNYLFLNHLRRYRFKLFQAELLVEICCGVSLRTLCQPVICCAEK